MRTLEKNIASFLGSFPGTVPVRAMELAFCGARRFGVFPCTGRP
ncbi:hypothetical protein AB0C21_27950 [Spirillospora sp. NPDC049024]